MFDPLTNDKRRFCGEYFLDSTILCNFSSQLQKVKLNLQLSYLCFSLLIVISFVYGAVSFSSQLLSVDGCTDACKVVFLKTMFANLHSYLKTMFANLHSYLKTIFANLHSYLKTTLVRLRPYLKRCFQTCIPTSKRRL